MEMAASAEIGVREKLREVMNLENLEAHLKDPNYLVRFAVCETGYGLDVLLYDPEPIIRRQVAAQGYGLDVLMHDENELVRCAVAQKGYGLDVLMYDDNKHVRYTAERVMLNKSLEQKESLSSKIADAQTRALHTPFVQTQRAQQEIM